MPTRPRTVSLALLILATGVFLRSFLPEADLPFDLSLAQGDNIDWPWYLNRALAAQGVINLDPTLVGYEGIFFQGYAQLYFALFGYSSVSITLFSLTPGLLVALFVFLALRRSGSVLALLGLGLASFNFLLVMYSRTPNVYLWVAAAGILFGLLWEGDGKKPLRRLLCLVLLALLFVALKSTVIFFLPCLLLAHVLTKGMDLRINKKVLVAGIIFLAVFIAIAREALWSRVALTVEILDRYGIRAESLEMVVLEIRRFLREQGRFLVSRMPIEFFLAVVSTLVIGVGLFRKRKALDFLDVYFAFIFVGANFLAASLRYRPLRYFLFCIPATLYLALRLPALCGMVWTKLGSLAQRTVLAAVLVFASLIAGFLYWDWSRAPTYTLRETREDFLEVAPGQANLIGTYAHLLALESGRRAFRFHPVFFGVSDSALEPTHAAIDVEVNLPRVREAFPDYPTWNLLERFFIRGWEGHLYRLPAGEALPARTLFEKGIAAHASGKVSQARAFWQESMALFPESSASTRALLLLSIEENAPAATRETYLKEALRRNPYHPFPWLVAAEAANRRHDRNATVEYSREVLRYAPRSTTYRDLLKKALEPS